MTEQTATKRSLIFLSHANPEDNDFTLWLGARLAAAGYTVWSDVTKLIGGEIFWDNIETAIRQYSVKVVSIFSKAGAQKIGFKNELSLAIVVEKKTGLPDFVIPVRLDDIDFSDFPPEIIRRNTIDFSRGWHDGLGQLLKKLETDQVPHSAESNAQALSAWSKSLLNLDSGIVTEEEAVLTNWLEVSALPTSIAISQVKRDIPNSSSNLLPWPVEYKGNIAISFSRLERTTSDQFKHISEIDLEHFLSSGTTLLPNFKRQEAHNIVASLLRQAWDRHVQGMRLQGNIFANGRVGYFVPLASGGITRTNFVGPTGKSGSRALLGFSPKKNVYWHFAPEMVPSVGKKLRYALVSHVIFSEDGVAPISDAARAHRLRRSFCKSWWQDRWRDLMLAYLAYVAGGRESIALPLSESRDLVVSMKPMVLTSPVTAIAPNSEPPQADDVDQIEDHDDEEEEVLEEEHEE